MTNSKKNLRVAKRKYTRVCYSKSPNIHRMGRRHGAPQPEKETWPANAIIYIDKGNSANLVACVTNIGNKVNDLIEEVRFSHSPGDVKLNLGGITILMLAIKRGNLEMVNDLLDLDSIDVNVVDNDGKTALDHAYELKENVISISLLAKQAKVEKYLSDFEKLEGEIEKFIQSGEANKRISFSCDANPYIKQKIKKGLNPNSQAKIEGGENSLYAYQFLPALVLSGLTIATALFSNKLIKSFSNPAKKHNKSSRIR